MAFKRPNSKVSATSVYFESMPYVVYGETGFIDYDDLEKRAKMFMPKLLIAGGKRVSARMGLRTNARYCRLCRSNIHGGHGSYFWTCCWKCGEVAF